MASTTSAPVCIPAPQTSQLDPRLTEKAGVLSKVVAWAVITGLPTLGLVASLYAQLPLFAALMAGCFLMATTVVCYRAITTFASTTLRLLVTARLMIVLVVAALLFCTTGFSWMT